MQSILYSTLNTYILLDVLLCSIADYYIWQGKSERSDWFFLGQDFAIRAVSTVSMEAVMETVIGCVFFVFESRQKTSMARVPYI